MYLNQEMIMQSTFKMKYPAIVLKEIHFMYPLKVTIITKAQSQLL